jgi:hypothetical protein
MIKRILLVLATAILMLAMVAMQIDAIPIIIAGFAFTISYVAVAGAFLILLVILMIGLYEC